jgi:hypothetical protein
MATNRREDMRADSARRDERDVRDAAGRQDSTSARKDGRDEELGTSPMMAHLLDALVAGTDIGHYGRLTFLTLYPDTSGRCSD